MLWRTSEVQNWKLALTIIKWLRKLINELNGTLSFFDIGIFQCRIVDRTTWNEPFRNVKWTWNASANNEKQLKVTKFCYHTHLHVLISTSRSIIDFKCPQNTRKLDTAQHDVMGYHEIFNRKWNVDALANPKVLNVTKS